MNRLHLPSNRSLFVICRAEASSDYRRARLRVPAVAARSAHLLQRPALLRVVGALVGLQLAVIGVARAADSDTGAGLSPRAPAVAVETSDVDPIHAPVPEAWFRSAGPEPAGRQELLAPAKPDDSRALAAWTEQADYLRQQLTRAGFGLGDRLHLRIYKESRELEVHLLRDGRFDHFRTFRICAISGSLGPKWREGDLQAPEGVYRITRDRMHPASDFHLAFNLGFPNPRDRAIGATGSNIMIHGGCASNGCFAMTDYYMEQLWVLVEAAFDAGQHAVDVHVFPFRMSEGNLHRHADSPHRAFWSTLVPLERYFRRTGHPPLIDLDGPEYRVLGAVPSEDAASVSSSAP